MILIKEEYVGCFRDLFMHFGTENADIKMGNRSIRKNVPVFRADGSWRELESEMEKMGIVKDEDWLHIRPQFVPMSDDSTIMNMVNKIEYEGRVITNRDEITDVLSGYYEAVAFINLKKNKSKHPVHFFAAVTKSEMIEHFSEFFKLSPEETGLDSKFYSLYKKEFEGFI